MAGDLQEKTRQQLEEELKHLRRQLTALDTAAEKQRESDLLRRAIDQISETVFSTENLQELFSRLHRIVSELISSENFYIALYNEETEMISFPYFVDQEDSLPEPIDIGQGLTGYVIRTGEPLLASPEVFDRLLGEGKINIVGTRPVDWLGVPLKRGDGTVMGAVAVQTYTEGIRYVDRDRDVLSLVSNQIARAIEKKYLEEALRVSEEKYRSLSNQLPLGVYRTTADGRILYVNKAFALIMEYDSVASFMATSAQEAYIDEIERKSQLSGWKEKGGVVSNELRFRTRKGNTIWVRDTGRVILDQRGEIEYIDGIIEDITDRKRTEEALKESEDQYRSLFETMAQGVIYQDGDGKIMSVNPAASRIIGRSFSQLKGRDFRDRRWKTAIREDGSEFEGDDLPPLKALKTGKKISNMVAGIFNPRLKKTVWINVSSVPQFKKGETNPYRVFSTFDDITERKEAETIQNILLKISQFASLDISIHDLLSRIQKQVNRLMDARNFYIALVRDREASLYTFPYITDVIPDEIVAPDKLIDLSGGFTDYVLRSGKPLLANSDRFQDLLASRDIKLIGTEARSWLGVPLTTAGGESLGVMVVQSYENPDAYSEKDSNVLSIVSSTIAWAIKLKQTEAEKADLEEKLVRSEKMEALGHLAGGVAHDLNNVLSAMVSYPDLLMMKLPGDSSLLRPIGQIKKSGQKAAAIVDDLLTLARRGVPIKEVINLNTILIDYLKSPVCQKLLDFHPGVEIQTDLDEELLNIKGSKIHINKMLMNLVSNGAEAMPDGGILSISTFNYHIDKPKEIYDSRMAAGSYAVVKVKDTGIGMSEEDLNRIFEPFYTKKVMGRSGTGLGMAVVWGTVKDHRGYIHLQSVEGGGATFEIFLPITREEFRSEAEDVPVENIRGKGEQVLVVDDVQEQRDIATDLLTHLGYRVDAVSSGEEAVNLLTDRIADVVLLDMIMEPGMDGLDTLKEILKIHPEQKVIIVSGYSESERIREAQRMGAELYIKKPYTMVRLGQAIREALENVERLQP
jgi:PAS domain S-box-containing protein